MISLVTTISGFAYKISSKSTALLWISNLVSIQSNCFNLKKREEELISDSRVLFFNDIVANCEPSSVYHIAISKLTQNVLIKKPSNCVGPLILVERDYGQEKTKVNKCKIRADGSNFF